MRDQKILLVTQARPKARLIESRSQIHTKHKIIITTLEPTIYQTFYIKSVSCFLSIYTNNSVVAGYEPNVTVTTFRDKGSEVTRIRLLGVQQANSRTNAKQAKREEPSLRNATNTSVISIVRIHESTTFKGTVKKGAISKVFSKLKRAGKTSSEQSLVKNTITTTRSR